MAYGLRTPTTALNYEEFLVPFSQISSMLVFFFLRSFFNSVTYGFVCRFNQFSSMPILPLFPISNTGDGQWVSQQRWGLAVGRTPFCLLCALCLELEQEMFWMLYLPCEICQAWPFRKTDLLSFWTILSSDLQMHVWTFPFWWDTMDTPESAGLNLPGQKPAHKTTNMAID